MRVLKCGDGEKGSIPVVCSWPQRLAAPGMEMRWHKVVPGAFLTCSCLACAQLLWALVVGPGANLQAGCPDLLLFLRMELAKGDLILPSATASGSSLLQNIPLETKRVPLSWYSPLGWGHPQPCGWWWQISGCWHPVPPLSTLSKPGRALSRAAGDGSCGHWHTSLPPCACLVRSDQEEDQSALRFLSRFN